MRQRGITLVELLLALTISALVMMVAGSAYTFGARTTQNLGNGREIAARRAAFEGTLTNLISHVYVDPDSTNTSTYFVSGDSLSGTATTSGGTSSNASGDESTLVFSVVGRHLPSALLSSTEDFETNNSKFGPQGGVTEIQLGTSPVGEAPAGTQGLFLREQTPSDTDATQGGEESLLSPDIETIRFEFYDGTEWVTTWDTTTQTTRRVPSAVRVTYQFRDDTEDHQFVVTIPSSDVTPDNPLTVESAT